MKTYNHVFKNLKVLDIGSMIAGPFAGTLLADFGAEVIKIELPDKGDSVREYGHEHPKEKKRSLSWLAIGRNKKCITLDIRTEEGKAIFKQFVSKVDVLIESFRPGTMEKWGLGYDELKKLNRRLIMLRVSGFGQHGPKSSEPGYDRVAQAFGGLTYLTGHPDQPPVRSGFTVADYGASFLGWGGILMALYYRDAVGTGEGQMIDVSLYDPLLMQWSDLMIAYDTLGVIAERTGNTIPSISPGKLYKTKDEKWVQISASNDRIFSRLCDMIGRHELKTDQRFENAYKRSEHRDVLEPIMEEWTAENNLETILRECSKNGIPASPVNSIEDLYHEEHLAERGDLVSIEDPVLGHFKMQGIFPKMSLTPGKLSHIGPRIGEHNDEIYSKYLGFTEEEIHELKSKGII